MADRDGIAAIGSGMHSAKFEQQERNTVQPDTFLTIENRSPGVQFDPQGNQKEKGGKNQQTKGGKKKVEEALYHQSRKFKVKSFPPLLKLWRVKKRKALKLKADIGVGVKRLNWGDTEFRIWKSEVCGGC